jgi:hypothetical protein
VERRKTFLLRNSFLETENARNRRSEKIMYSVKCRILSSSTNPRDGGLSVGMPETIKIKIA